MHAAEPYFQFPPNTYTTLTTPLKDKFFKKQVFSSPIKKLELSLEDSHSQVKSCLSRIQDPLWKSVCTEMVDIMGPSSVYKIWNSKLGAYCAEGKTMEFYCPTVEVAQFINQYSFLIIGSLQRYFPILRHLKVKVR
ncbi:MAG: hypothetical protein JNJ47_08020 [Alphaproteobacteria bacterium]|nr:hypothetical protein [Alphaproteobacteria bacterium]